MTVSSTSAPSHSNMTQRLYQKIPFLNKNVFENVRYCLSVPKIKTRHDLGRRLSCSTISLPLVEKDFQ